MNCCTPGYVRSSCATAIPTISSATLIGRIHSVLTQRRPMRTSGIRAMIGGIRRDHSAKTIRSSAADSSVSRGSGRYSGSAAETARTALRLPFGRLPSLAVFMTCAPRPPRPRAVGGSRVYKNVTQARKLYGQGSCIDSVRSCESPVNYLSVEQADLDLDTSKESAHTAPNRLLCKHF